MPLPPPHLDDRSFQDIVDETKRLIPRFTPEWTNHNVSDPGVALIELFAWMSEMVLFRVNQVPERLYVHFLNLVGVEPFPASTARTDLTFWLSAATDKPVVVPAGTQVATAAGGAQEPVVFATVGERVIIPPTLVAAHTAAAHTGEAVEALGDLRYPGQAVVVFPSSPLAPGDSLLLGFEEPLAGLVLRMDVEADAEGIGVDPRNPPLAWEVWSGEGWVAAQVHEDTTGGLNRDGSIVLVLPPVHQPLTLAGVGAHWLRARLTHPAPGQPTYEASPRLHSLSAHAVGATTPAEHAAVAPAERLGRSDGTPEQRFTVSRRPVARRRPDEVVRVITHDTATVWQEVPDFSASGPGDLHVVWDSSTGEVRFGPRVRYPDGTVRQHGAIPPDGAEVAVTSYRHGGGAAGNVGSGTLTALRSTVPMVASVTNLRPATGGVDAETVDEAKTRGPLMLRTGMRAVTASDYERLTHETSAEVARARCLPAADGRQPVRVLVVPRLAGDPRQHVIDDFALSSHLLDSVCAVLDERRPVGVAVEVGTPFYQGVSIAALVRALPGRPLPMVRDRVLDALHRYVHPLTGGPDGTGWPFEADLTAAVVAQLIEAVEGVERVDEVQLFAFDLRNGRRVGVGRDALRLEPHALFLSAAHQVVVK